MNRPWFRLAIVCWLLSGFLFANAWWALPRAYEQVWDRHARGMGYILAYKIEDGVVVPARFGGSSGNTFQYRGGLRINGRFRNPPMFGWLWGAVSIEADVVWYQDLVSGSHSTPWDIDIIRQIEAIATGQIARGDMAWWGIDTPESIARMTGYVAPIRVDPWTLEFEQPIPEMGVPERPEQLVLVSLLTGGALAMGGVAWLCLAMGLLWIRVRLRRARQGQCPRCGYDLTGSHGRCPECGGLVSP